MRLTVLLILFTSFQAWAQSAPADTGLRTITDLAGNLTFDLNDLKDKSERRTIDYAVSNLTGDYRSPCVAEREELYKTLPAYPMENFQDPTVFRLSRGGQLKVDPGLSGGRVKLTLPIR